MHANPTGRVVPHSLIINVNELQLRSKRTFTQPCMYSELLQLFNNFQLLPTVVMV